jgi:hypothetical protein
MDRTARIAVALSKRKYSPVLRERIERLLDGREDRERLRCCNSGCFVCVQELRAILREVENESEPDPPADERKSGCGIE